MKGRYRGIVEKVVRGKHGAYAVARCEQLQGSVTFSLKQPVWKEVDYPEAGMYVWLSDLRQKRAGWRATSVQFVRPDDEQ